MEKVKEVINKVTHKDGHAHDSTLGHDATHPTHTTGTHTTGTHTTGTHATGGGLTGSHPTGTHTTGGGLTGSHNTGTHTGGGLTGSHTTGTHTTAGQPSVVDKLNPMVDSDRDGKTNFGLAKEGPGAHNNHHTGTGVGNGALGSGTHGTAPHSSHLANQADPRVDSSATHGTAPHSSHLANQADPRVDSSTHGTAAHSSHLANKADPRVDTSSYGNTHSTHTGIGGNSAHGGSTNAGPHSTNIGNAIDPRVDSDRSNYGHQSGGLTGGTHGTTGGLTGSSHQPLTGSSHQPLTDTHTQGSIGHQHQHGHQQGVGGVSGGQHLGHSEGPAPHTAGTHKSDLLNKLDPRIDSDRDGSKTLGNTNQQY